MSIATWSSEICQRLLHTLTFLSGEGSWTLRRHERIVLDAVLARLSETDAIAVRHQLASPYFVERIPDGRINILRHYRGPTGSTFASEAFDDCLFKVRIAVDGNMLEAHVVFYKRRLFSIEFNKEGGFFRDKAIRVDSVRRGRAAQSYTAAIDRLEHGAEAGGAGKRGEAE